MGRTAAEKRARRSRALTPDEADFAANNFYLVWWYLGMRGLDPDEWFDAVIIRYLETVKRWFEEPELRAYSFTTIAASAMRSALWNEQRKRRCQPQTVSLYSTIPGTDNLTLENTLAAPPDERLASGQ